jgi:rare lipoprotein A
LLGGGGVDTFTVGSSGFGDRYPNLFGTRVTTRPPKIPYQKGKASWYGPGFYGRRTANGDILKPGQLTAAHRTLPFGTRVRVTNLKTGQSTIVRINDRGPFHGNRIIDLAEKPAQEIGLISSGLGDVKLEVLS